jgi:hypothetical protein
LIRDSDALLVFEVGIQQESGVVPDGTSLGKLRWGRLKVFHIPFRYQKRGKEGQSRTKDVAANLD